ncbi:histone deacetylase [Chitinophagaceae bacterium IBVUCB1]|nr:histone deacetylase [Chitinophagaceae bacterium IBVUCB1]
MLKIAFHSLYAHPLPAGHRFPMEKYELIPAQLLHEDIITQDNLFAPHPADEATILLTHDADYWQRMKNLQLTEKEIRAIGFPLSAKLVEREIRICQGTIDCAMYALQYGAALNVAGGTHHAFANKGEGFCLLNDFAVAANYLLQQKMVRKILIVDLDVHQGNGTAALFAGRDDVFTFSMHGQHNYPFHKEKSHLDIGLQDGTTGSEYLAILNDTLPRLIDTVRPDVVFYLCGVDVLATDKFGKLKLTMDECAERDLVVYTLCKKHGIPVAAAMGGGYSPKVKHIVNAHCNTFRIAKDVYGL